MAERNVTVQHQTIPSSQAGRVSVSVEFPKLCLFQKPIGRCDRHVSVVIFHTLKGELVREIFVDVVI